MINVALILDSVNEEGIRGDCLSCKHFTPSCDDKDGIWGECWFQRKHLFRAIPEYGCRYHELKK